MNVAMICETLVTPRADGAAVTRDDVTCNIQYAANGMFRLCVLPHAIDCRRRTQTPARSPSQPLIILPWSTTAA